MHPLLILLERIVWVAFSLCAAWIVALYCGLQEQDVRMAAEALGQVAETLNNL